ncbi:hypothetical protein SAY87_020467 [Trapa incisa]|uniref:Calmodulin-binding heat-shock protein n=1 Tax=Trapa incisa TaxID=236973 RepID=A0AAN7PP45_9MYRT|nr:hypothetical protein SAY87_020467 [Trapa incisa]
MSLACCVPIVETVYCLACARWLWKKCLYTAGHESENWGHATAQEFEPVPRFCRLILASYEDDLRNPLWAPPGGYRIEPDLVIIRKDYGQTQGRAPPYFVYLDHEHSDIVLTIRGLNLARESDYAVLLDNKLGQARLDGGYVHNGLLKAAEWVFHAENEVLRDLLERFENYSLSFVGHSLGAGVASLLTMVAIKNHEKLGKIGRRRIRCFAIAPARCTSLNLAVRYADVINSVVLQDDFLPRTTTDLEDAFKCFCCLPCLLCVLCLKDTCTFEEKWLGDPRRLYAPGRLYHIVERKPLRLGRFPPMVKTAVPVDGRFEHMVIACNATSDHAIIWIERESQRAFDLMLEREKAMGVPISQRMERQEYIAWEHEHSKEYEAALQKAVDFQVPSVYSHPPSQYGTFQEAEEGESSTRWSDASSLSTGRRRRLGWHDFMKRLFDVDDYWGQQDEE